MTHHTWQITSRLMQRDLHFEAGRGLYTSQWIHHRTGTNILLPLAHGHPAWNMEFSFNVNGETLTSSSPDLKLLDNKQDVLSLWLLLEIQGIEVEITYTVFEDHPVLRKGLKIRNRRADPVRVTHLILESLELCVGHPDEQALFSFYGVQPRELFFSGRMDDPAIYQRNVHTGEGFIAMNEAPGILKRINTSWTWQSGIQLGYDTDIFPFERSLQPDETFTAAHTGIAFTLEGTDSAPEWVMPSYTAAILQRKGERFNPPWIYNTWETFFRDIDQSLIEALIPIAGQLGFDIFTIDDGWQEVMGSNAIRTSHFPDGLHHLREMVEAHGMRLGLWFALAVTDASTPAAMEHPEWLCIDGTGNPRHTFTMSGSAPVMCLATPYWEVVTRQISEAVCEYREG